MENNFSDNATFVPTIPAAVPATRPTGKHCRKPDPAALPIAVKGHYVCNLCYRIPYNTQAALWEHQTQFHLNDNKFRCPNSNCKLLFPTNGVKDDHVKRHKNKNEMQMYPHCRSGAERMCMPFLSADQFIDALKETALTNKHWIPSEEKATLYIKPLFRTGHILGLAPSPEYASLFYASPVSNYFKEGLSPLNLYLEDEFRRATGVGAGGVSITNNGLVAWDESELLQHLKRVSSRQVEHVIPEGRNNCRISDSKKSRHQNRLLIPRLV